MVESFSPDFYLPDMELYVELTTLKQKLVRKKNRKLRRLRELYPDIRIKLFYGRDFRMLMLKFGRMALLDDLTGTSGQSTPPRIHAAAVPGAAAPTRPSTAAGTGVQDPRADAGPAGLAGGGEVPRDPAGVRSRRRGRRRRRASEAAGAAPLAGPLAAPVHDAGPV